MAERTERTERLLNLVICLMATSSAVSRLEIQRGVKGYSDAATESAFERMFERDKEELRSMGIPVTTVHDIDGEVLGYRVPQERYVLPAIDLTVGERAAIAVAAQVWSQAVVAPVAGTAVRKLESMDAGLEEWTPVDLRGDVQLTAHDAALLPLMGAIRQDKAVHFSYRTPAEEHARTRAVSPWGLRSSSGRWFLVGFDHDRADVRTFRLSRIAGPVTITAAERRQQPPPEFDISTSDGNTHADDSTVTAVLRIAPGHGAALRRLAVASADDALTAEVVTVTGSTLDDLTALVCAAGPDVVVVEPPDLIRAVRASLAAVLSAHLAGGS
jgi:proteasome accessory factor B